MIPKNRLEKLAAKEYKRHKDIRKMKPPWVILAGSVIFHFIMAVAMSFTFVEQPKMPMYIHKINKARGIDVVFMQYEEPIPRIERFEKTEKAVNINVKVAVKNETQKNIQKAVPEKVETRTAWEMALLASRNSGGQNSQGSSGQQGNPGDRPGMMSAGGIISDNMITKAGGSGIRSDKIYDNMVIPAGKGSDFGAGGNDSAGFKFGVSEKGTGGGRIDIPGRGGSGGSGGLGKDGPGQGLSAGTGKGSGGGKGTGIGIGDGIGKGGMGTGSGQGSGSGIGSGKDGIGEGGPGAGGYELASSRNNPNIANRSSSGSNSNTGSPRKNAIPEDKRSKINREGFKADIGKDMSGPKVETPQKTDNRDFSDALQQEINKNLHTLRKIHEDWQNDSIPNIPKALQITVTLNKTGAQISISSIDFHNTSLSTRIRDDLTKKIKDWKFVSLSDGKDDPTSWPIKINGKINWQ